MGAHWQIVAFPVILPWRQEFWTLPLYFPDLKVGVAPGWPPEMPYRSMEMPPEALGPTKELKHYRPGELRQWHAFGEMRHAQEDLGDLVQILRHYGEEPPEAAEAGRPPAAEVWRLAWQLEKMSADQEAQLLLVDKGQDWLQEILKPEPWEDRPTFGAPGVAEMVDPELAGLRYRLWRRVMAPYLEGDYAPLLLGRASRSLFLTLMGWPRWTGLKLVELALPGCRTPEEWLAAASGDTLPPFQPRFQELLGECLASTRKDFSQLQNANRRLQEFVAEEVTPRWPAPPDWHWDLEIWRPDGELDEPNPVLCWTGAGKGILPG
jgi:hypothetical protein